jgi:hypothetical protein
MVGGVVGRPAEAAVVVVEAVGWEGGEDAGFEEGVAGDAEGVGEHSDTGVVWYAGRVLHIDT